MINIHTHIEKTGDQQGPAVENAAHQAAVTSTGKESEEQWTHVFA